MKALLSVFTAIVTLLSPGIQTTGTPPVDTFVTLAESSTFGPGGSIFDLTTRVAPPAYIRPPSSNPADYDHENDTLKLASCSSDETTWTAFKDILSNAADSTFIWLPQSCRMKIFLTASKGDSAEFTIANSKDEITVYCGDPTVCKPEIVYRAGSYPTSMITDGTAGDGLIAFGEQPQKHVFEIGTGRIAAGSATQTCDWDATFRDNYSFPSKVVKLDAADCQITDSGATAWGPGDLARVRTSRITGTGITQGQWVGRVVCVKTYGTAAANDGVLDPAGEPDLCAGITEDNTVRFENAIPWDLKPDAYYWGDPANVGDTFVKHGSDTGGPTTYAATSGHVIEQVERAGSTRCDIVGPGICGNGTGTDVFAENIWFYGLAWSVKPQYVGGMFSAWKRSFGGGHYKGGPLNDSGRVAAVTFGKEVPAWEAHSASLHSMDWWGTASNSKCFGEVTEVIVSGSSDLQVKVAADSSTRCWDGAGTDTPNWGDPEIAFSDEVADARLAGKRFLFTKGSFTDLGTYGTWTLTITGLNGSNPDGTGVPIDTTPGGIASNIDRFAAASYYVQSYTSGIRVVDTFFENPLQHGIDQGCVGCVYSGNVVRSVPSESIRGRGPFRHGTGGSCGSIHELSDQDHAFVPYDTSNGEPNRHGEGCGHAFFKLRARDSGTLTWPLGTATGSDYTPTGAAFWVRATSQNGAANDQWSIVGSSAEGEFYTGLAGTAADVDFNDNYDGDQGAPPNPPYLLHALVSLRNRGGTGTDMDDNFAGATNPTTINDVAGNEYGESDTLHADLLGEVGLEPSSLYLPADAEFWCAESGPIGRMGFYYDDFSNLATLSKLPALIRYEIAKGLGGTCTLP